MGFSENGVYFRFFVGFWQVSVKMNVFLKDEWQNTCLNEEDVSLFWFFDLLFCYFELFE